MRRDDNPYADTVGECLTSPPTVVRFNKPRLQRVRSGFVSYIAARGLAEAKNRFRAQAFYHEFVKEPASISEYGRLIARIALTAKADENYLAEWNLSRTHAECPRGSMSR